MTIRYDNERFFEPVRQIIDRVLGVGPLRRKRDLAVVWDVWDIAVGQRVAAHARPMRIENGVLTVLVDSAAWHHQLQMLQRKIVQELNARLGTAPVRELRFRVQR